MPDTTSDETLRLPPITIGAAWSVTLQLCGDPRAIESISDATPCVVTLINHGFANGDNIRIGENANATDGPNGTTGGRWVVANATADTFELAGSEATGFGTLDGGVVAKAMDCTGGTITFAAVNSSWAANQSIITDSIIGTTPLIAPTFTWGDDTVDAAAGQPMGLFTLSLDGAASFALQTTPGVGEYCARIYYVDSTSTPQEPIDAIVEVQF